MNSWSFGLLPPNESLDHLATRRLAADHPPEGIRTAPKGIELFNSYHGDESKVKAEVWADNPRRCCRR